MSSSSANIYFVNASPFDCLMVSISDASFAKLSCTTWPAMGSCESNCCRCRLMGGKDCQVALDDGLSSNEPGLAGRLRAIDVPAHFHVHLDVLLRLALELLRHRADLRELRAVGCSLELEGEHTLLDARRRRALARTPFSRGRRQRVVAARVPTARPTAAAPWCRA